VALFNELCSNAATLAASCFTDAYGILAGREVQQSGAKQAYTQAPLGATVDNPEGGESAPNASQTCATLPPELSPSEHEHCY